MSFTGSIDNPCINVFRQVVHLYTPATIFHIFTKLLETFCANSSSTKVDPSFCHGDFAIKFFIVKNEPSNDNTTDSMSQDTGLSRDCKDKFYTRNDVASRCVELLRKHIPTGLVWIEPSAGEGVFLRLIPHAIGYDIEPNHSSIHKADFLTLDIPEGCVVYGNPPFGRQSSLAKRFIRHAAEKADWIGFILPRSFLKPSMQSAFPLQFHLVESIELPENSFLVNNLPYDVPCVFQLWKRESNNRTLEETATPNGFTYVKKTDGYSLAFRRVGINAGRCCLPSSTLSSQSHYFVRLEDERKTSYVLESSQSHVFPTNTTGPRSLSKHEATSFLNTAIANASTTLN